MEMVRESNPELAARIEELGPVVAAYNLLMEAKEVGLMINADTLDVETVRLVYLMKMKMQKTNESKAKSQSQVMRRGR